MAPAGLQTGAAPGLASCTSCGHRYDPAETSACASCPLNAGCSVSCCPACGLSSLDLGRSWVGRLRCRVTRRSVRGAALSGEAALTAFPDGAAVVVSCLDGLPAGPRGRLRAYGIEAGRTLRILRASAAVTIVRVGHTELAFESEIADHVRATLVPEV